MSHFAKLRQDLDAKEQELSELTKQLEEKKRALADVSAGLNGRTDEVTTMKKRLDALAKIAPTLETAMERKTTSEDVVQHVLEAALRSGHLTSSDIVQFTVNIAKGLDGKNRADVLSEILADLVDDKLSLDAAVGVAIANFAGVNDVVKSALTWALANQANAADLLEGVAKTTYDMLGEKAKANTLQPAKETPIVNLPKENSSASSAGNPSQTATPSSKNGLRGQAEDFKPRNTPYGQQNGQQNGNQNGNPSGGGGGRGWESFARENGAQRFTDSGPSPGSRVASAAQRGAWSSVPSWGL